MVANIPAGGNTEDPLVIAEWEEIVTTLRAGKEAGSRWKKFFLEGKWKRTLAGMSVQAWQVSRRTETWHSTVPRTKLGPRR